MALAKSYAISLIGLTGTVVEVEADLSSNLPGFVIVGLPDASLLEATARVKAATTNSGLPLANRKLTINLSPAAVPKYGSSFDLAIAVAAMRASGLIEDESRWLFIGELGLDGRVRPVRGVLPQVLAAKQNGFDRVMVPIENFAEASLVTGIEVEPVNSLRVAAAKLGVDIELADQDVEIEAVDEVRPSVVEKDIADVYGQAFAVQALIVSAVGGHNLLMIGSPGVGKTMMAERLTGLLPDLDMQSAIETTAVHSISKSAGRVGSEFISRPPFQAPHHSASQAAIIGGGQGIPAPGMVSLAHNGVLFLDEAPEFQVPALESLRQSIESHEVTIARASGIARFPAKFQLVLAANPCPCGQAMSNNGACRCAPAARMRYLNKLSGPLLDRIDIRLRITETNAAAVALERKEASRLTSAVAREQVIAARAFGADRNKRYGFALNAHAPSSALKAIYSVDESVTEQLDRALKLGQLNLRGYDRCLRVALSIADLAGRAPTKGDVAAAMMLRGEDRLAA